jgi:hypothetical protein
MEAKLPPYPFGQKGLIIRGKYPGCSSKLIDGTVETGYYFLSIQDPYQPKVNLSRPPQRALASLLR